MVSVFKRNKSIRGILRYNEQKVAAGAARLIGEGWYGKDLQDMSYDFKARRLEDLALRNMRCVKPAVHLSLNFSNNDRLDDKRLFTIALEYLRRIGLYKQPFLVYRHFDAGHPHVHIVSVTVRPSGNLIVIHEPGRNILQTARMEIEKKFGLESPRRNEKQLLPPTLTGPRLFPIEYGRCETRPAVSNVVHEVLTRYKVTSLPELNAVLIQFNVRADHHPGSDVNKSVLYRLIKDGRHLGTPIKSRHIHGNPTLKNLEAVFSRNIAEKIDRREILIRKLDSVLFTRTSEAALLLTLQSKGISVVLDHGEDGQLRSVSYIDNYAGVVCEGSELGTAYSADSLSVRFGHFKEVSAKLPIAARAGESVSYISSAIPAHDPSRKDLRLQLSKKQGLRI